MPVYMYKIFYFVLLTPVFAVTAENNKPDFEIPETHIEVHVGRPDAVPKPELLPEDASQSSEEATPEDPIKALQSEVKTLRDEIKLFQSTLDLMINKIMTDLREENVLLRKEVQRLNEMQEQYGLPDMAIIPRPGMELIDEILNEEFQSEEAPSAVEESYTDEPFEFTPIHQWGRTPEVAAEIGEEAASLLGMVGVVPRNSRREDIENLGRQLRSTYDAYDNINIEVFDDVATAEQFIESQVGDPARRVLSISKHRGEGRDIILFLNNGKAEEVPPAEN